MKLRNKKTGEIGYLHSDSDNQVQVVRNSGYNYKYYNSLAELIYEWEDPKEHWCIEGDEVVLEENGDFSFDRGCEEIGNYFETKEEAEKAVEKIKAWKRLKDKGFKFELWDYDGGNYHEKINTGRILFRVSDSVDDNDLDLLFGGEE